MADPFNFQTIYQRIIEVGWGDDIWITLSYNGYSGSATYEYIPEGEEDPVPGSTNFSAPNFCTIETTDPSIGVLNTKEVGSDADWFIVAEGGESQVITLESEMTGDIKKNMLAFNIGNTFTVTTDIPENSYHSSSTYHEGHTFINVGRMKALWRGLFGDDEEEAYQAVLDANEQLFRLACGAVTISDTAQPDLLHAAHCVCRIVIIKPGTKLFYAYDLGGGTLGGRALNTPEFDLEIQADHDVFWGKWFITEAIENDSPWDVLFKLKKIPDVPPDESYEILATQ